MNNKRIPMILGGGLAGLSASYHKGGIVYEKNSTYGGMCQTSEVNGYKFDLGIHVLHTKNKQVLNLLDKLGVDLSENNRDAWIKSHGSLTRYPFQANLFGLPIPIIKDCLEGFFENYYERKNNYVKLIGLNYKDWIYRSFGKGIAERFMIPYSEKFWTISTSEINTDWLDSRIPMPKLDDVIEGALSDQEKDFGPNFKFKYPKSYGIKALPKAFIDNGVNVQLNKKAIDIDLFNKVVSFDDGTKQAYLSLISTLPLPELFKLFKKIPLEVYKAVKGLKYNSIFNINIGIDRENISDKHWMYFLEEKYPMFRISFLNNFDSNMTPKGKSSITAEIAYSYRKPINKNTILKSVIDSLIDENIIKKDDLIDIIDIIDIKYGYVIYDHNREYNLDIIKTWLNKEEIITCGRYGSWEYQWMDDAILDGIRASKQLDKGVKK